LEWTHIKRRLKDNDPRVVVSALFFASSNETAVAGARDTDLLSLVDSQNEYVRALALQTIWSAGDRGDARAVAAGLWHARYGEDSYCENHWGSLVLADLPELSYEELRARIEPAFLGRAIERGQPTAVDVQKFAEDLDRMWTAVSGYTSVSIPPQLELRVGRRDQAYGVDLPGLAPSAFSRSTTFIARHWSWGGYVRQGPVENPLKGPSDEDIEEAHAAMAAALREHWAAGNEWFGRRFDPSGLASVVRTRPDLVAKWTAVDPNRSEDVQLLWRCGSFYEALCEVLLEIDPGAGAKLFKVLASQGPAVRIVDSVTGIRTLDSALFSASPSPPVVALWERRLEECQTDRELLEMAVLCRGQHASAWLADRVAADSRSGVPIRRVRAILLSGFVPGRIAVSRQADPSDMPNWEDEMTRRARQWRSRAEWAEEWLDRFATAPGEDEANAAFRLFLACVDSRYGGYVEQCLQQATPSRRVFFEASYEETRRAVEANEKELRDHFLGQKVALDQVWPWVKATTI
jgi:hypothetical protein